MRTFSRTVRSIAIARVPRVVAPLIATAILTIVAPGETRAGSRNTRAILASALRWSAPAPSGARSRNTRSTG